ncbi:MAG: hypothetical protein IPO23_10745 [Flavobacterium sp.]|nr:hypothetical protein [Flavobacterium sp.]
MKKSILTIGLFSLMMVLTSFTSPEIGGSNTAPKPRMFEIGGSNTAPKPRLFDIGGSNTAPKPMYEIEDIAQDNVCNRRLQSQDNYCK